MNSSLNKFYISLILGLGISVTVGVASFGVSTYTLKDKNYIALVNDSPILVNQFKETMNRIKKQYAQNTGIDYDSKNGQQTYKEMKKMAFQETILMKIILGEADKRNIVVTDKDIDNEISVLKKNAFKGNEEAFLKALAKNKFTVEKLREAYVDELKARKLKEALVKENIKVNDEDVKKYYQENQIQFVIFDEVSVAHIVLATEKEAKDIIKKIENGESFEKLAEKNSIDPRSAKYGGKIGFVAKGQTAKEFTDAAFELKKDGEFTKEPVKINESYHIIKRLAYKPPKLKEFEEVKDSIKDKVTQEKTGKFLSEWRETNFKKAKIEYNKFYKDYEVQQQPKEEK